MNLILPKPNRFKELEVEPHQVPMIETIRYALSIPDFVRSRQINAQLSWCKSRGYTAQSMKKHLMETFQKEISGTLTEFEQNLYKTMKDADAKTGSSG